MTSSALTEPIFADSAPSATKAAPVTQAVDFAIVYSLHAAKARRRARVILHDEHLAADAVQEAVISLWLLGDRCTPERGSYSALLWTLTHRRAVDIVRRRNAGLRTVHLGASAALLVDPQLGPEDTAVAGEQAVRLWAAVDALTPNKREVVTLTYRYGHSNARIAGLLGIPLGTVKGRLRAAKADLLELLAADRHDDA